jgi:hypothetical protein
MVATLANFVRRPLGRPAEGRFACILIVPVIALGLAGPALAQRTCSPANLGDTCALTGTAGFETGLWDLGFLRLDKNSVAVFWGDGQQSEGLVRCFEPVLHPNQCHVFGTHTYATPGTYTVDISYVPPGLFSSRTDTTNTATISPPGDFVILSIGDSVGSGEGNPPVQYSAAGVDPAPPQVPPGGFWGWDDPGSDYCLPPSCPSPPITQTTPPEEAEMLRNNCHRSFLAGPALAAALIARTNPATFVHFACSGAAVGQIGIPESDYPGRSNIVQQLKIARKHLPRIDVLLISGGFNNMIFRRIEYEQTGNVAVGFGKFVERCLLHPLDPCEDDPKFTTDISDSIFGNSGRVLVGHEENRPDVEFRFPGLHREYQDLDKEIHCINPADDSPEPDCSETQIPKLVLITEFFDPTHDQNGNLGGCLVKESRWAYVHGVITQVNGEVLKSPWHAVTGIQDDFLKHGLCADDADRWVVNTVESGPIQNDLSGTGHPNGAGHADYRNRIYAAIVNYNPPTTTISATTGGAQYAFGTWTNQGVAVTLSANNGIKESGVKQTYYAVDDPNCNFAAVSDDPNNPLNCLIYQGPFTISASGKHTVTFFSLNGHGNPEPVKSAQVWIDVGAPLQVGPGLQIIHRGQNAVYNITVGHTGWDGPVVNLSCETDAPQATCGVKPDSVSVDADGISTATVATAGSSIVITPKSADRNAPLGPPAVLQIVMALATFVFLAGMAMAMRRKRWTYVSSFAGLAVLFGLLFAGCGNTPSGTKGGTYNVVITGVSGDTSHTSHAVVVVE